MTHYVMVGLSTLDGMTHMQLMEPGKIYSVPLPINYLVSAGQQVVVRVQVDYCAQEVPEPGSHLQWAIGAVQIPRVYDDSLVPTTRPLYEIMRDVVEHGLANPTHGSNCACMDKFVWEIRAHLSRAMPPDTRPYNDRVNQGEIRSRVDARARMQGILHMLWRNL